MYTQVSNGNVFTCTRVRAAIFNYLNSSKVLVIPRKRWLRPLITEKLTGTLNINTNKQKKTDIWEARWPSGRASDSRARGRGCDPHSGRLVVSLSKIHLPPPKSTGNTQEAVTPSRHD